MIERKIIIGLITSTEYLQKLQEKGLWNARLLESVAAARLATWCWDYFKTYEKAPGKDIESIYLSKSKSGKIPKDLMDEIGEEILPGLSEEYESVDFNLSYLLDSTEKYFQERALFVHAQDIQTLLSKGNLEEAEKLAFDYVGIQSKASDLDPFILTTKEIRERKHDVPRMLLSPWLREGQTNIIYGDAGTGKTLLSLAIAYMLGLTEKDYGEEKCEIVTDKHKGKGTWKVRNPTGCLYLDGELGEIDMEARIRQFTWLGIQSQRFKMRVFSIPQFQLETGDVFSFSKRENQVKIVDWLKRHPTYKLVILDSISTLFDLKDENDNSEWNTKVSPFLRDLRALGIANILLHHSGKDGKRGLRGASAMSAMAENIFRLVRHQSIDSDAGEAWFVLNKDKQRQAGFSFKQFGLKFTQNDDKTQTHWKVTGVVSD